MDIQRLLQNRDFQTNLFILFVAISLIQFFETKLLISVIVFILFLINLPKLIDMSTNEELTKLNIDKYEVGDDMYYNTHIHDLLIRLKPFKKHNKVTYKQGVKYMRKFFKILKILEHDSIQNRNNYFDLANDYLKEAINHFQSMSISMPERSFLNGLKYGDYETTKKTNELSSILKELYNECYAILINIGHTFNDEWSENPNIYTREIDLNTDRVESHNKNDEVMWALY